MMLFRNSSRFFSSRINNYRQSLSSAFNIAFLWFFGVHLLEFFPEGYLFLKDKLWFLVLGYSIATETMSVLFL